jgi:hypothetical protein
MRRRDNTVATYMMLHICLTSVGPNPLIIWTCKYEIAPLPHTSHRIPGRMHGPMDSSSHASLQGLANGSRSLARGPSWRLFQLRATLPRNLSINRYLLKKGGYLTKFVDYAPAHAHFDSKLRQEHRRLTTNRLQATAKSCRPAWPALCCMPPCESSRSAVRRQTSLTI